MKKENRFLQWLRRPHGFFLGLIYILTVAAIVVSIVLVVLGEAGSTMSFISYGLFGLAAILLAYTVYTIIIYAPTVKRKIVEKLKSYKFTANIMENYGFKTTVFALVSFGITVAFAVMNLVGSIRYRSIWYGAIAAYYFVLILFRGGVMLADNKCKKKFAENTEFYDKCKWKIYLSSGAFLILLEFAMIAAIMQMMLSDRPAQSGEIMAIANAAYTFYKMTMAIYNLVKAKKYKNPVTQSLRNLNFADACMSIVSLTVLMVTTFDDGTSDNSMIYVKSIVGFVACAAIIALATFMIIKSSNKLTHLKGETNDEQK